MNQTDIWELQDHRDNTARELVKWYTLFQLSLMDWRDTRTIRNSWKYIPVRFDNWFSISQYKKWLQKKPYRILWLRVDEVKYIYGKRNKGKKLIEESLY